MYIYIYIYIYIYMLAAAASYFSSLSTRVYADAFDMCDNLPTAQSKAYKSLKTSKKVSIRIAPTADGSVKGEVSEVRTTMTHHYDSSL